MSRVPVRFGVLASVVVLINVAGVLWIRAEVLAGQRQVRIVAALPARDVDTADRFALVFDNPCVEAHLVGRPLARSPFVLAPALKGDWFWAAPDRLEFRLAERLPPGRVFTLRATADAEAQLGRGLSGPSEFRFQTRALELDGCDFVAADQTNATFELHFNQPVSPADLLRYIQVTDVDGRRTLDTTVLSGEPAERLVVRTTRPRKDELRIVLDERLAGLDAELPLGRPVIRQLKVVPAFALLRAEVERPRLQRDVDVAMHFSRELDRKQDPPTVTVSPAVEDLRARLEWGQLILSGPFESNRRYSVTVPATVLSLNGESLGDPQAISFEIPDRQPAVSFPLSEGILSPDGNAAVEVEVVNISGLRLRAARLHMNNLVAALHRSHDPEQTHRQLPEKTVPLKLPRNAPTRMLLDLHDVIDLPRGVFHITAEAIDQPWTGDAAVVTLTDLGLTIKREQGSVFVWVTSLRTARPVADTTITALSQNNQVLARSTTDAAGIARLDVSNTGPDGPVWLVTAEHDGDLCFLRPDERPWVLDDVDQSGRVAPTTYDVLLYAERGVYRPGDAVHLTGIVRDAAGQLPPAFPLAIRVTRPDGRKVAELPVTFEPTGQGLFHCDYVTRDDGQLGRYRFAATLPGADEALGQTKVLVEEFVPVRLEVVAQPTQPRFGPEDKPQVHVKSRYLFDQPAAGLPLVITGEFRRVPFNSARFAQFTFGTAEPTESWTLPEIKTELDPNGEATVELPQPQKPMRGIWESNLAATVTEVGGRSVSSSAPVTVDTSDYHLGLRLPAGRVVAPDSPADVEWVMVSGSDEPVSGKVTFELARVERDAAIEIVNQRPVWKSVERLVPVWKQEETADGTEPLHLPLQVSGAGQHRLRATHLDTQSTTTLDFHVTANAAEAQALTLDRPERLDIVLDRDNYAPGGTAKALVRSPFAGTLLITVETDRVLDQRLLELNGSTAEFELPVPATLRGGAFVGAILVRGIDPAQDKWLPHRAIGLTRLVTDHQAAILPVNILAPRKLRPGAPVSVRVETGSGPPTTAASMPSAPVSMPASPPAVVHLWAVDEGILQTTAYRTPNPYDHFFARRELQVTSADVFGDLLPDYRRPVSMARIGGDSGDEEESLRRSPVSSRRRAPAVVWRTSAPVGPEGTLTVPLDLPNITGEIRLMAVAVDGDRYGAAEQPLTLTTPLMVEAAWPRFVAPGDRLQVPVKLFNTSDAPMTADIEWNVAGPLTIEPPRENHGITVEPGKPHTVWLAATATAMGVANVTVTARAGTGAGEPLVETCEASFPIRPVAPLHAETHFLRIAAGKETTLDVPGDYLPGTGRATLTIAGQPQVELLPALDQLLDYPYGCVEQTTSRLYALLYAPELLEAGNEGASRARQVRDMMEAGLVRLWSMQTRDGGVSYWPGGQYSAVWPSAYVGHFLLAAKRAGYQAEPRFVEELLKYLKSRLHVESGPADEAEGMNDNTRALLCHVLAGFGQPQEGWQARLAERLDRLDMAGRAHLAAAWLEIGQKDRAAAALPPDTIALTVAGTTGGRITSQVQQEATLLAVLLDLDREHAWIPALVRNLEAARTDGAWGTTLENATALAALVRYQLLAPEPGIFAGEIRIGQEQHLTFDHQRPTTIRFPLDGAPIRLTSQGAGDIFLTLQTRGLSTGGDPAPYDHQLQIRRHWLDRAGKPIDPAALRVGNLVHVKVTLAAPHLGSDGVIENVAVVDPLPGGMEVENPQLVTSANEVPTLHEADQPDRVEFRDDRVIIFTLAEAKERTFRYALRVVTVGRFAIPPIEAACMYDPGVASRSGGGTMEVKP